jgi:hypothetical protein
VTVDFPSRLIFKPVVDCPRIEGITMDGDLRDWQAIAPLPPLCTLDGMEPFAEMKIAYNDSGIYVATFTERERAVAVSRQRPHSADSLQVWLDTRGGLSGHRATRFCHHFILLPKGGGRGRDDPVGRQMEIRRASDQPTLARPEDITIAIHQDETSYSLEALLPAAILNGFTPELGQTIGFTYLITDLVRGRQTYACGDEFPYSYDPSTWGRLRLGQ